MHSDTETPPEVYTATVTGQFTVSSCNSKMIDPAESSDLLSGSMLSLLDSMGHMTLTELELSC